MSITHEALEGWVRANLATITEEIATIVGHESPSHDAQSLQSLAIKLDQRYRDADGSVRSLGTHLHITFGLGDKWLSQAKPALILGHFDTVWPIGALERMPVSIAANRMSGPGIFDMKTSLVMIPWALAAVKAKGLALTRRVEVLLTSDEEIGSPSSRDLIENLARESAYVLVLEPPLADGRLKTQRKGVGQFRVEITGQSAHAGIEPERGVSAIIELAEQVLQIQKMARPELGTTLNVGLIEGGTAPNVVAAHAWAVIDVRVSCSAEASRIEQEFCTLSSITPGTSLTVTGGFRRPPMERTPQSISLFRQARRIGAKLGLDLQEGATGGASDGNFTSALGVPTLDGLGCPGAGAHAPHEHIDLRELPSRIALLAALILELNPLETMPDE